VLCVVRLDRLGRSLRELLETLEMPKQRGIALMSLEERIDTTTAAGELKTRRKQDGNMDAISCFSTGRQKHYHRKALPPFPKRSQNDIVGVRDRI
jgi:Resolvase, N terminal domain